MNNKHQENGAPAGPLIFTVPAYGFVMALYFDWLGRSNRAAPSSCPDLEARTQEHDCACDCHARRAVLGSLAIRARGDFARTPRDECDG
jgi:hypothetical protein